MNYELSEAISGLKGLPMDDQRPEGDRRVGSNYELALANSQQLIHMKPVVFGKPQFLEKLVPARVAPKVFHGRII